MLNVFCLIMLFENSSYVVANDFGFTRWNPGKSFLRRGVIVT